MIEQAFADPALLVVRVDVQVIDEVVPHCHERDGTLIQLNHPDLIFLQDACAEVILVFVKEMALAALKIRQGFLARDPPQNSYRVEVCRAVVANEKLFRHGWKKIEPNGWHRPFGSKLGHATVI